MGLCHNLYVKRKQHFIGTSGTITPGPWFWYVSTEPAEPIKWIDSYPGEWNLPRLAVMLDKEWPQWAIHVQPEEPALADLPNNTYYYQENMRST